jgi:hypothetical protein
MRDKESIKRVVLDEYNRFKNKQIFNDYKYDGILKYSRENQAKRLAEIFETVRKG